MSLTLRPADSTTTEAAAVEAACRRSLGAWTAVKRHLPMQEFHWEWCDLASDQERLCVIAPREHGKTETFTVNQVCWRCMYNPGFYAFVFANTEEQAVEYKAKIDEAMEEVAPMLVGNARRKSDKLTIFANFSRVRVAGAQTSVRGGHPDLIVGDDVLKDNATRTHLQRTRTIEWWKATVGGMAHPPTWRRVRGSGPAGHQRGRLAWFPATKVQLVGTPFHQGDLLLKMKDNPLYLWRRYAADFEPAECKAVSGVQTLAVETNELLAA
jgi:hypothetical protein